MVVGDEDVNLSFHFLAPPISYQRNLEFVLLLSKTLRGLPSNHTSRSKQQHCVNASRGEGEYADRNKRTINIRLDGKELSCGVIVTLKRFIQLLPDSGRLRVEAQTGENKYTKLSTSAKPIAAKIG